jgi:hypothetical protein
MNEPEGKKTTICHSLISPTIKMLGFFFSSTWHLGHQILQPVKASLHCDENRSKLVHFEAQKYIFQC